MPPRNSEEEFQPPQWVRDEDQLGNKSDLISKRQKRILAIIFSTAIPLCLWAGWFEFGRAQSGNWRAWVYTFEWPFFGGVAIYLWRRLLKGDVPKIPRPDLGALARLADEDERKTKPGE